MFPLIYSDTIIIYLSDIREQKLVCFIHLIIKQWGDRGKERGGEEIRKDLLKWYGGVDAEGISRSLKNEQKEKVVRIIYGKKIPKKT